MLAAGHAASFDLFNLCVWVKNNGGMGSLYRSRHELVFVFRNGKQQHRNNVQLGPSAATAPMSGIIPAPTAYPAKGTNGLLNCIRPSSRFLSSLTRCSMRRSRETSLRVPDIAAMDLFVVPTIGFELLYAFVIVRLDRRDLIWIDVTRHPTAEWIARQITEAFPWNEAPRYLIRDRDRIFGAIVIRR